MLPLEKRMEGLYRKQILDNGIRVVTEEIPHLRSVAIGFWVKTGSRNESLPQNGISHFIEHLLFKGTERYSAVEIAQLIDSVGGYMDASTSQEYTCFYARVLDEQLAPAIELLTELMLHPKFDPQELEVERRVILEEIKATEDTPDDYIHVLLANTIWPDHPLGRSIIGTAKSVAGFSRAQIIDFYHQHYQPANIVVTAAGNIKHERLIELLEHWHFPTSQISANVNHQPIPHFNRQAVGYNKNLEQVHLCVGTRGLPQNHQNYFGVELLNIILGGGNSSRLFQQIREQRGLAYSVYSYFTSFHDTGMGVIYAATSRESYLEVIDLILQQLRCLKEIEIPPDELERSKNHLKGQLMLGLESTFNRMGALAKHEIYFGRQFSLDETLAGINRVSTQDLQQLAAELFDRQYLALIALGNVNAEQLSSNFLRARRWRQ
jgi:predicted Zn-dependent peptidase